MTLNLLVTGAYAAGFGWRQAGIEDAQRVSYPMLALSVLSIGMLAASGWLGGKLAYHYGVRVADESTQGHGYDRAATTGRTGGSPWTSRR